MNVDRSKVAFLRTSALASMVSRFPLLVVHCAPSEVFWLLSLGCCRSEVFHLVPHILDTVILFPFLPIEDGSAGARFRAMNIPSGLQVLRENEEDSSGRQTGSGLT